MTVGFCAWICHCRLNCGVSSATGATMTTTQSNWIQFEIQHAMNKKEIREIMIFIFTFQLRNRLKRFFELFQLTEKIMFTLWIFFQYVSYFVYFENFVNCCYHNVLIHHYLIDFQQVRWVLYIYKDRHNPIKFFSKRRVKL